MKAKTHLHVRMIFLLIKEVLKVIKSGQTHSYFILKHSPTELMSLKN